MTGASVKVGSQTNSWDAKNALQCAVEGDYYTFEANGEFTISTVKADWDDGWKTGTYTLNGNWNTTSTSATASLQRVDGNIPPAKIGETVTYKVKKDFSTIEASFSAAEVKTYYFLHGQITGDPNWKSVALTQEGDNYKYTGNLVAGEFGVKICSDPSGADWSQTAWIGGAANITEANKSYSFVDGANSKSTLAGEYTIVYNQTAKTIEFKTDGGDTPTPPVPAGKDLYLVGTFNGWQPGDANYKMTQNGDTYTISVPALDINAETNDVQFKISGTTWDDPSYGAEGDPNATEALPVDVILNTPMNAWKGSGCNFRSAVALTNVTVTFVLSSDASVASTLTVTADGGDTPTPPVPTPTDLYLVGNFNGWQPGDANYKMTQNGDTYTISVPALDINAETNDVQFKISGTTWDDPSYGAEGDPNATEALPVDVILNTPMNAWAGSGCNFRSAVSLTNVTVTFVLSSDASVASTLTVTADGGDTPTPPDPTPTDLYLVGNFNGWQPGDANYKMTQDGDTYTISIPALTVTDPEEGVQFKVSGTTWDDPSYGAEGDPNATEALPVDVTLNTPMNAWAGSGCNFKLTESLTNVNITFILSSDATLPSQLTVAGQSAIEAVEAAAVEAAAEYYNLQGIRVLEPEAGQLYIVNRDGKVSKEIAR